MRRIRFRIVLVAAMASAGLLAGASGLRGAEVPRADAGPSEEGTFATDRAVTIRAAGVDASTPAGAATATVAQTSQCPERISCGPDCVATLSTWFCILSVSWEGKVQIGSLQFGPSIKFECWICDCWYTYESATGTQRFKRDTDGGCGGEIDGLIFA